MSGRERGFTLIELMVVILIMALVAGITLSAVQSMQKDQDRFRCLNNLRMIHNAMRMYNLDELGYPPFAVAEAQQHITETPVLSAAGNRNVPMWDTDGDGTGDAVAFPTGMWILSELGYLDSPARLNCPAAFDVFAYDGTAAVQLLDFGATATELRGYRSWWQSWYYCSYQNYDPDVDSWQYDPLRDNTVIAGRDGRRQLWNAAAGATLASGNDVTNGLQRYTPGPDTIITWCPHHRQVGEGGRLENTMILFANGSVEMKHRFVDWADAGDAPWLYPAHDTDWW
jgi:prepilin-type N-terminal cleavage/methylation domain-containing protein